MFSTLKNLKEKYQNSSTWTEFIVSYFTGLDDIYKRLGEAKTDKERIKILTEGLELSQSEVKRLMEENDKMLTRIKELEEENKKLKIVNESKSLVGLKSEILKLGTSISSLREAIIEVPPKN